MTASATLISIPKSQRQRHPVTPIQSLQSIQPNEAKRGPLTTGLPSHILSTRRPPRSTQ
ncbi:hypothetical protein CPB83DRAFT_851119 [Crepidotus variabilis]|uniref:Uncharacterized protein n=1 Tax=Crepidotus variabilis TaxID=179855 RepID=A0A9P6JS49_9AGAR|nr:hypothetical protein CPB83DRAFT_851119 [Crepidotus variabilis]